MSSSRTTFSVGKLAKSAGINVETVRYYERIGMLPKPQRKTSGYRQYGPEDLRRLKFISHAKDLGFTLKEIRELLELRVHPETTCEEVRRQAEAKIADVERKLKQLQRIHNALSKLAAACRGKGPAGDCPILEVLETEITTGESKNEKQ